MLDHIRFPRQRLRTQQGVLWAGACAARHRPDHGSRPRTHRRRHASRRLRCERQALPLVRRWHCRSSRVHIAACADARRVDAFYQAAIGADGRENGAPACARTIIGLLRRVRPRSRRPQHRSRLPRAPNDRGTPMAAPDRRTSTPSSAAPSPCRVCTAPGRSRAAAEIDAKMGEIAPHVGAPGTRLQPDRGAAGQARVSVAQPSRQRGNVFHPRRQWRECASALRTHPVRAGDVVAACPPGSRKPRINSSTPVPANSGSSQ